MVCNPKVELKKVIKDTMVIIPYPIFRKKVLKFLSSLYSELSGEENLDKDIESMQSQLLDTCAEDFIKNVKKEIDFFDPILLPYIENHDALMIFVKIDDELISLYSMEEIDIINLNEKGCLG